MTKKRSTQPGRRKGTRASLSKKIAHLPLERAAYIQPMQPELVKTLPSGPNWQYEVKWDGYRVVAVTTKDVWSLYSRNRNNLTARFAGVLKQLQPLQCEEAVLDGELVAVDAAGRPSFQLLQNYSSKGKVGLAYIAFDLLNLDGHSLLSLPLIERRMLLQEFVKGSDLLISEPLDAELSDVLQVVHDQQLEGIVAKERSSIYEPGRRGRSWFKLRIGLTQQFVIGGYTEGAPFDSLIVGYYAKSKFVYAGKVRAGFIPATRHRVRKQMEPLRVEKCPFYELPLSTSSRWGEGLTAEDLKKCVWVKPQLVVEISFVEWTDSGNLRHAKFVGLLGKKGAKKVRRGS